MKKILLTQNKYALVNDEDYIELSKYNWYARKIYKSNDLYYAARKSGKSVSMHRLIMNPKTDEFIDHINGNGLDNRKENLRVCTQSQNLANGKLFLNNTSGVKGVSWNKKNKKWRAYISFNNKKIHLGYFVNIDEAKNAYEKASKEYFGKFYSDGIRKKDKELQKEIDNIKLEKKERLYSNNSSGLRGVSWHKRDKKWQSRIVINGKRKYLGHYNCIADAKAAYDVAEGSKFKHLEGIT